MFDVTYLHRRQPFDPRLVRKMLDAVEKFVEAGAEQSGCEPRCRAADPADQIAGQGGNHEQRRQRGVERAKQHLEMIGVDMMVVVDPLPGGGQKRHLEHPVAMQHPAVQHVPDQRIGKQDQCDRRDRRQWCGGVPHEQADRKRGQRQIGDDGVMLEIGDHQFAEGHPVQIMRPCPEGAVLARACGVHSMSARSFRLGASDSGGAGGGV